MAESSASVSSQPASSKRRLLAGNTLKKFRIVKTVLVVRVKLSIE